MKISLIYILCSMFVVLLGRPIIAQEKSHIFIETYQGNLISGFLKETVLEFATKYGKLNLEVKDIAHINLGVHPPTEDKIRILKALKKLSSDVYKERAIAQKDLIELYNYSYFFLKEYKSSDAEVSKRISDILEIIETEKDLKLLPNGPLDTILTFDGSIFKGEIIHEKLTLDTNDFGQLIIHLCKIRILRKSMNYNSNFNLDGAKAYKNWIRTGIHVYGDFAIKASGKIDLSPGNGIYIVEPRGSSNWSVNGVGAGTLYGKIGSGEQFIIGENYNGKALIIGELQLYISPAGWEANPEGFYKIQVR